MLGCKLYVAVGLSRAGKGNSLQALQHILIHQEVATADDLWICLNQLTIILEGDNMLPVSHICCSASCLVWSAMSEDQNLTISNILFCSVGTAPGDRLNCQHISGNFR